MRASIEKFKEDVMKEDFRQYLLRMTSAETYNYDETKKPTYAVNESFRKLAVDWTALTALDWLVQT